MADLTDRDPEILDQAATATAIGRSLDWFYRNWRILVERYGFPRPLPGPERSRRWELAKVRAWRAREATTPPAPPLHDDALAAELRARSRRIAAGLQ